MPILPNNVSNKELWRRTEQEPVLNQIRRRKRTWLGHTHSKKVRWQHWRASTPVDATWPPRKGTNKEKHLEERSGEGDVDNRITNAWSHSSN